MRARAPVTSWPPGIMTGLDGVILRPISLPDAMSEPEKVIEPMTMSRTVGTEIWSGIEAPALPERRMKSSIAMRAAAPPPIALKSDTSCGIAVIFTVRAVYSPSPPPMRDADDDDDPAGRRDPAVGGEEDGGRADREGHAAGGQEVPVAGRGGRVHPHQADDEPGRADEPDETDDGFEGVHRQAAFSDSALGATGFLRNIWSIRSVTT